ncbi:MAG: AAA family ATPase [Lachnospiraceae bacterium]|nr:AAA family ATPase [Lachnospiraceae bacterium]
MGIYLNPDKQLFERAVNSEIYVDKTEFIKYTNRYLYTDNEYIAISRPRRFGKTMAMNMLAAYYGKNCDSRELFAQFKIADDETFEKYLNKYNVIQINMRDLISGADNVRGMIIKLTKRLIFEFGEEYPEVKLFDDTDLIQSIADVYIKTKIPFVILIDEWDAIFRVRGVSEDEQIAYLDFLRNLLKDKPYVALAYMTGILPIKKYGEHSALNMFTEYSMTNQREFAEFTGFTEDEVQILCKKYDMPYDETKRWYDGYNLRGISVYNPRSVVMSMTGHDYDSYWTKTETYEALKVYIEMNYDGLRDTVVSLMSGGRTVIDTHSFTNDMVTFATKDDVLTLLIHLGYLTYDFDTKEVWIPNQEIMGEYATTLKVLGWSEVAEALRCSDELLKATLAKNVDKVSATLEQIHRSETSIMAYNDENALSAVITIAYYAARRDYELIRKLPGGNGFADISFLPRRGVSSPAMIVELKVDETAGGAIAQIKDKKYVEGLKTYSGKVLLVGISYNRKTKKHGCVIEEIEK